MNIQRSNTPEVTQAQTDMSLASILYVQDAC